VKVDRTRRGPLPDGNSRGVLKVGTGGKRDQTIEKGSKVTEKGVRWTRKRRCGGGEPSISISVQKAWGI